MSKIITASKLNRLWKTGILPIKNKVDELEANGGRNVVYLSQAEYDALPDTKLTDNVEYRITDAGVNGSAKNVGYDNSVSGLETTNVQGAIDGLNTKVNDSLVNEDNESFNFGVKDGVRGFFTNPSRADDSFIPFKSGKCASGTVTLSKTETTTISLGFKPKYICVVFSANANKYDSGVVVYNSDVDESKTFMHNPSSYTRNIPNTNSNDINQITDDGFVFGKVSTGIYGYYFAVG